MAMIDHLKFYSHQILKKRQFKVRELTNQPSEDYRHQSRFLEEKFNQKFHNSSLTYQDRVHSQKIMVIQNKNTNKLFKRESLRNE